MKITRKTGKTGTLWNDVKVGATFDYNNLIYIKITDALDLAPSGVPRELETINAVLLGSGVTAYFHDNEYVNLVNAELIITE